MPLEDMYECSFACTCGEKSFYVRYRRKDEDIIAWLEGVVQPAMWKAHLTLSPLCFSPAADLKLPVSEAADGVGMKVVN